MSNDTVLVTGASSGIGEALAKQFAAGGFDLVLVARSEDKLESLADTLCAESDIQVHVVPADLSHRAAAKKLASTLKEKRLNISILVNNAGVLERGRFTEIPRTSHQKLIDLNISAMTSMLAEFLPDMVGRGEGRVLNVASVTAFQPVPLAATYAASKAYILSLTESISEELHGTGVTATALCPGLTETNMVSKDPDANNGHYTPAFLIGEVEEVAKAGYRACLKGDVVCVPGVVNQVTTMSSRAAPKWLIRRMSGIMTRYSPK